MDADDGHEAVAAGVDGDEGCASAAGDVVADGEAAAGDQEGERQGEQDDGEGQAACADQQPVEARLAAFHQGGQAGRPVQVH